MTNEIKSLLASVIHHTSEIERLTNEGQHMKAHFHATEIREMGHMIATKLFWLTRNSGEAK